MKHQIGQLIGIDVGSRTVKAAQWGADRSHPPRTVSIRRLSDDATPTDREMAELSSALARRDFRGCRVALAAPDSILRSTLLSLPPRSSGAPLESLARSEIEASLGVGSAFTLATWDLPSRTTSGTSTDVSVVACTRADLDPLIEAFERHGFEVEAVDVAHCAVARLVEPVNPEPNDLTVALDIGYSSARVSLVLGGEVVYHRKIAAGGLASLHEELASRFGIDPDAAPMLTGEIDATRPFAQEARQIVGMFLTTISRDVETAISYGLNSYRDAQPRRIRVVGGGGEIPEVELFLGDMLSIPVTPTHPPHALPRPMFMAAAGVAMRHREAAV